MACMSHRIIYFLIAAASIAGYAKAASPTPAPTASPETLEPWGHFVGRVSTMRPKPGDAEYSSEFPAWQEILLGDFKYIDRKHVDWTAQKGDHIDGASIPKLFWSWLVGTPEIGPYFDASVIHDSYCYRKQHDLPGKEREWSAILLMFYEGMKCRGTGEFEAQTKYWAVLKGGPPKDRSLWQRIFGSPDDPPTKTPARGPAAQLLTTSMLLLDDSQIA